MSPEALAKLLAVRCGVQVDAGLAERLARYLDLLLRWNARTNLSAVREPEAIVTRHFGESLQCARALPAGIATLLDYGAGAGFPGAVIALARPEIAVTLAESQGKKAAFLRGLCRDLGLKAEVHAGRVETLGADRRFAAVTLRAVDRMEEACREARGRTEPGGWLVLLTTRKGLGEVAQNIGGIAWRPPVSLVGSEQGLVAMGRVLADSPGPPAVS